MDSTKGDLSRPTPGSHKSYLDTIKTDSRVFEASAHRQTVVTFDPEVVDNMSVLNEPQISLLHNKDRPMSRGGFLLVVVKEKRRGSLGSMTLAPDTSDSSLKKKLIKCFSFCNEHLKMDPIIKKDKIQKKSKTHDLDMRSELNARSIELSVDIENNSIYRGTRLNATELGTPDWGVKIVKKKTSSPKRKSKFSNSSHPGHGNQEFRSQGNISSESHSNSPVQTGDFQESEARQRSQKALDQSTEIIGRPKSLEDYFPAIKLKKYLVNKEVNTQGNHERNRIILVLAILALLLLITELFFSWK